MKKSIPFLWVILIAFTFQLSACASDDSGPSFEYGEIRFSFNRGNEPAGGPVQEDSLSDAVDMVVTVKHADGSPTHYSAHVFVVSEENGLYLSSPLQLAPGDYILTSLYLVEADAQVIFATPKEGSAEAGNVSTPLPLQFTIADPDNDHLQVEVLPVLGTSPSDFGFSFTPPNWPE